MFMVQKVEGDSRYLNFQMVEDQCFDEVFLFASKLPGQTEDLWCGLGMHYL